MQRSKQEKIDEFTKELELFIDLRYKINRETDMCNHSFVVKELLPQYKQSKLLLENVFKELLDNNSQP